MKPLVLLALTLSLSSALRDCDPQVAAEAFRKKVNSEPWPYFETDPYKNQTAESQQEIDEYLLNKDMVCALKYETDDKINYHLRDFSTADDATSNGYIITHQGRCGACSNTQDLAVYLTTNLTEPVRKCGFLGIISSKLDYNCIRDIGFSDQCAQIWLYNTENTKKDCFWTCMLSWIRNEPFNKPDGSLNDCLQCDEDESGPVFKYYSGRTRRNSGIKSSIYRPPEQFYNMTHCYY